MSAIISMDFSQFYQRVAASKSAVERDLQNSVTRAARHGTTVAKAGDWKDRTGRLRATIIHKELGWSGRTYWGAYQTQVPYAIYVEHDTKPHDIPSDIRPPGKPLHFYWERMGVWFTGYGVKHPGTTGFHFMAVSSRQAHEALVDDLQTLEHLKAIWHQ